jgi:hypothetical protein
MRLMIDIAKPKGVGQSSGRLDARGERNHEQIKIRITPERIS